MNNLISIVAGTSETETLGIPTVYLAANTTLFLKIWRGNPSRYCYANFEVSCALYCE